MGTLTNLALAPFALVFRLSYAHPVVAIVVSTLAGLAALATGHEHWMTVLISFAAYILVWWDESTAPKQPGAESDAG